jgi:hypothetical protein
MFDFNNILDNDIVMKRWIKYLIGYDGKNTEVCFVEYLIYNKYSLVCEDYACKGSCYRDIKSVAERLV